VVKHTKTAIQAFTPITRLIPLLMMIGPAKSTTANGRATWTLSLGNGAIKGALNVGLARVHFTQRDTTERAITRLLNGQYLRLTSASKA